MPRLQSLLTLALVIAGAGEALWLAQHPPARRTSAAPPVEPTGVVLPQDIPGTRLDEPSVRRLLPFLVDSPWSRYDSLAIVRSLADQERDYDWPEHPAGRITIRTNNLGFRSDTPTSPAKSGPRVIIGGDSHTFGLVDNSETMAAVLGARLSAGGPRVEVIDAGVGGTGPDEELALLKLLLPLQPDVEVIVFYTGNDFSNALAFSDFRSKRPMAPISDATKALMDDAHRPVFAQCASQAYHFHYRPGDDEVAYAAALAVCRGMAGNCRAHALPFVLGVLPALEDVRPDDPDCAFERAALKLSAEDLAAGRRLGERLVHDLQADGVTVVDFGPAMRADSRPLFWRVDHHLNVDGHALVASLLEEPVRQALARR